MLPSRHRRRRRRRRLRSCQVRKAPLANLISIPPPPSSSQSVRQSVSHSQCLGRWARSTLGGLHAGMMLVAVGSWQTGAGGRHAASASVSQSRVSRCQNKIRIALWSPISGLISKLVAAVDRCSLPLYSWTRSIYKHNISDFTRRDETYDQSSKPIEFIPPLLSTFLSFIPHFAHHPSLLACAFCTL